MGWVYINPEPGLYVVGFYDPQGNWVPESDHDSMEEAVERVRYLNGGDVYRFSTKVVGSCG